MNLENYSSYSSEFVHGSIDGLVTTFAVINGAIGAHLSLKSVLILGLVNVIADGFTIAAGKYLSAKAEVDTLKKEGKTRSVSPLNSAIVIFISFAISGLIPLIPLFIRYYNEGNVKAGDITNDYTVIMYMITALALYGIGWLRGKMTGDDPHTTAREVALIGGGAAILALFVGRTLQVWRH
jgi:VIT1/CCC1 family predicted Fe2+/Mn2+ transporter